MRYRLGGHLGLGGRWSDRPIGCGVSEGTLLGSAYRLTGIFTM